MSVTYRPALITDAPLIAAFQIAMARETENLELDPATVERGVRAVFESPARGQYFVASDNDRPVASLLITHEWSDWRNGTIWWMQSVYVLPSYRRQGVFKALYQFVHEQAKADPAVMGLRLYVELHNARAQDVYRKLGMSSDRYTVFEWMKSF